MVLGALVGLDTHKKSKRKHLSFNHGVEKFADESHPRDLLEPLANSLAHANLREERGKEKHKEKRSQEGREVIEEGAAKRGRFNTKKRREKATCRYPQEMDLLTQR